MGVGEEVPDGGVEGGSGLRRAPEGSRAKKDTPPSTSPGKDPPETPPIWRAPLSPLPLLTADHRELWFQAKALGAQFSTSCLRAQVSWHLWGGSSQSCQRGLKCSPTGFVSLRGPPHWGVTSESGLVLWPWVGLG